MRDALLSGLTLDIFHRNADKVGMACVAQTINCLHSLMLASGDRAATTPIYEVFRMYMPHKGGQGVRVAFDAPSLTNPLAQITPVGGNSTAGSIPSETSLPALSGSASVSAGKLTLTVVNTHLTQAFTAALRLGDFIPRTASGQVLHADDVHACNTLQHPGVVRAQAIGIDLPRTNGAELRHTFPPACVTAITMQS